MQPGSGPPAGERWNVNMPAVIVVVFVFLLGVVVWVVATPAGDDGQTGGTVATLDQTSTSAPAASTSPTLSPTPLPATVPRTDPDPTSTAAPTTAPPTTTATTTATTTTPAPTTTAVPSPPAPATTAPGADDGAVPGDLGIPDRPMRQPPCDGGYITVLASPIGEQATPDAVSAVLDQYPGSNYLRTDQTCPSLSPSAGGDPIYVIYLGPFVVASDACAARAEGPEDAYARELSDELDPDHTVACA